MQDLINYLAVYGPAGMFLAAFLAGSILPFSSELVFLTLLGAGASPIALLICATTGNVLGAVFNYWIGTLGREEWIARYAKVPPDKLERGKRYVHRYGAWAGLLSIIPIVGDLIVVAMGYLRTSIPLSLFTITISKYLRYQFIFSAWFAAQS